MSTFIDSVGHDGVFCPPWQLILEQVPSPVLKVAVTLRSARYADDRFTLTVSLACVAEPNSELLWQVEQVTPASATCFVCLPVTGTALWHDVHPVGASAGEVAWQRIVTVPKVFEESTPKQVGADGMPPTPLRAAPWQSPQELVKSPAVA